MAALLKGVTLKQKAGAEIKDVSADEALKGKVVAMYFSAHWCPPCRGFTPVLKDFYEEAVAEHGAKFEILFVSFDRSAADLKSYMDEAHGDWLFLPHGAKQIEELSTKFSVNGIPALIVVKEDGTVITENGRSDVQGGSPANTVKGWLSK